MATIEEVQQAIKHWAAGTYRGITTDTLGAPVDIINLAISPITKPLGLYSDNPAFGSKHLRQIAGMPTEDANIIETASGMTSPGGAVHAMIVGAARLGRAVAAEKTLQSGENMAEVFNKTGAYMDADNKWKTVISDKAASFNDKGIVRVDGDVMIRSGIYEKYDPLVGPKTNPATLDSVLNHPELFSLYPELKDISVFPLNSLSGDTRGVSNSSGIGLRMDKEDNVLSTLLHEVQHKIQNIEGFTGGGNAAQFRKISPAAEIKVQKIDSSKPLRAGSAEADAVDRFQKRITEDRAQAIIQYANIPGEQEARFTQETMNFNENQLGASVLRLLRNEKSPQSWDKRGTQAEYDAGSVVIKKD
jgi:hypothetical protein